MQQEHVPQPKQHEQEVAERRPVIDFTQMTPREGVALFDALGRAYHAHDDAHRHGDYVPNPYGDLLDRIEQDLNHAAENSEDALTIYAALMSDPKSEDAVNGAADMALSLLQRNLDNPDVRQRVIDPLLKAVHDGEGVGEEAATHILSDIVQADWLDESTARSLDEHLPVELQRWDMDPDI